MALQREQRAAWEEQAEARGAEARRLQQLLCEALEADEEQEAGTAAAAAEVSLTLTLILALTLTLAVLPAYRIRLPTEKELQMQVSTDVAELREYEKVLLTRPCPCP